MDRNSIIGLVLIAGILIVFSTMNSEEPSKKKKEKGKQPVITEETDTLSTDSLNVEDVTPVVDSVAVVEQPVDSAIVDSLSTTQLDSLNKIKAEKAEIAQLENRYGVLAPAAKGSEECHTLKNDFMRIDFCEKGAQIKLVELKNYRSYQAYNKEISKDSTPLVLIDSTNSFSFDIMKGDMSQQFSTDDLYFSEHKIEGNKITLKAKGKGKSYIAFEYEITDDYELTMKVISSGLDPNTVFSELTWEMKARNNEKSRKSENQVAGVFYKYENDGRDYLSETTDDDEEIEASMEWIAFKQAFFSAILITDGQFKKGGKMMHQIIESGPYIKKYRARFENPGLQPNTTSEFIWYLGPNDYDRLSEYDRDMHKILNHGWKIFGWINRNFFLPLYQWLAGMGLNHGLIILLLTIIIRLITMPLVFRNYRSSAKMRLLKPEIDEINKKFPDQKDAMERQKATMALYRSTGVNPMAGCLPMLIQMPILFAMFRLVPTLLELRQESFLWADDLSSYDAIVSWSAYVPFLSDIYGNHVSLFTLLMAGATLGYTMLNMNQMTASSQPGMPNMKFIMYLFPIMMIFFFNSYSSGLSYYYFLSSLLSMAVMFAIKKYFIDENKLLVQIQENKKKPKKKSKFQQRLEDMQRQQQNRKK